MMILDNNNRIGGALGRLFAECDLDEAVRDFSPERRSFRIHGHSTTIRLEKAFWEVLEDLAGQERMTMVQLITSIQDHCPQLDNRNLASCLRVVCMRTTSQLTE